MDWMKMPPLAALRAFSSFAEHGNLADAAKGLNVSHAAISQQLRALETYLGVALVERQGRALQLTPEGQRLAQATQLGFAMISNVVQEVAAERDARPLHISCTPMFAAKWLMPRLGCFRERHPEVDLVLDPTGAVVDLDAAGVDIALRYGQGPWSGLDAELLMSVQLVVVAAPSLVQGQQVSQPEDLRCFPWIEELGTNEASSWMCSRGVDGGPQGARITLPGNLLLDAVLRGQGVAMKIKEFVQEELDSQRLLTLFHEEVSGGYYIVTRPGFMRPQTRKFLSWLRQQREK